jgi:hypothetical protein
MKKCYRESERKGITEKEKEGRLLDWSHLA